MVKQIYNPRLLMSGLLVLFVLSQTISINGKTLIAEPNSILIGFCSYIQRYDGSILAGSAIRRVEPIYPEEAKKKGISGSVVVKVTVDEEGNVISTRALKGHKLLRKAAIEAAKGWKFSPTSLSGKPVKVVGTLSFFFNKAAK